MDWIHLAQDIEKFARSCEHSSKMKIEAHKRRGIFWLAEKLLAAFHERLFRMELVIGSELQILTLKFHSCIEYCYIPCV